jgi:hypothetical protein
MGIAEHGSRSHLLDKARYRGRASCTARPDCACQDDRIARPPVRRPGHAWGGLRLEPRRADRSRRRRGQPADCFARVPRGHAGTVVADRSQLPGSVHQVRPLVGVAETSAAAADADTARCWRHGPNIRLDREVGRRVADYASRDRPGAEDRPPGCGLAERRPCWRTAGRRPRRQAGT